VQLPKIKLWRLRWRCCWRQPTPLAGDFCRRLKTWHRVSHHKPPCMSTQSVAQGCTTLPFHLRLQACSSDDKPHQQLLQPTVTPENRNQHPLSYRKQLVRASGRFRLAIGGGMRRPFGEPAQFSIIADYCRALRGGLPERAFPIQRRVSAAYVRANGTSGQGPS
jgi:hypothetical protein